MKKMSLVVVVAFLLLTACQSNGKVAVTTSPNANATPSGTATNTATPPPSKLVTDTPAPSVTDTTPKLYYMNKNDYIKPIDPAKTNKQVVLITIDDGPKKMEWIQPIIQSLNKHHAKAIFFDIGGSIKDHPDLLKYTYDSGETIGNHTWTHPLLNTLTDAQIDQELDQTQAIIKQTIGIDPLFFRPPNAAGNDYVHAKVKSMGMLYMTWSDGSLDWESAYKNKPDKIIANTLSQLNPGVIILMHEYSWTGAMLDKLMTDIEQKGYTFVDPDSIDLSKS